MYTRRHTDLMRNPLGALVLALSAAIALSVYLGVAKVVALALE